MGSCTLTVVASQTKHEILCCCPCLRGLCLCRCCPCCLQWVRLPLRLRLHRRRPCGCLPCCPRRPGCPRELRCRPCCRCLCWTLRSLSCLRQCLPSCRALCA